MLVAGKVREGTSPAIAGVVSAALPIVALAVVGVRANLFRRTVAA